MTVFFVSVRFFFSCKHVFCFCVEFAVWFDFHGVMFDQKFSDWLLFLWTCCVLFFESVLFICFEEMICFCFFCYLYRSLKSIRPTCCVAFCVCDVYKSVCHHNTYHDTTESNKTRKHQIKFTQHWQHHPKTHYNKKLIESESSRTEQYSSTIPLTTWLQLDNITHLLLHV